ncbi:MAG: nitrogen fixation protein NifM [Propionivibrio sp.]|uniref:peptidylprolyl isomerase n=1 Tax=Candidatus Propionivibrio dominans TaxID=2954373 RepID=A0A9D7F830_9RHOO|nr:nitrogen fixation protein NifM [Candidatus Propionivibrio dominans]
MQYGYLELKLAWELFAKAPETLSEAERSRLFKVASRQNNIEQHILASGEAANVVVPAATLANRLEEIRKRYPSADEFIQDLERIGLGETELEEAVERDLRVEAVLEKVAAEASPVSVVDAEIYYRLHPESFERPQSRRLRHILITYDNGQQKDKARTQLEVLRMTLKNADQFGAAAQRLSQCPTALEGGQLGVVQRKQLYPQLEAAAFALGAGQTSKVLESPIGLHILRCDEIFPSGMLPFAEVQEKIIDHLYDKRRRKAQRDWIVRCCVNTEPEVELARNSA